MTPSSLNSDPQDPGIESDLLTTIGTRALTSLIAIGADIVGLVDQNGVLQRLHYRNRELDVYGLDRHVGKRLRDCVTSESVPKIDAMLDPSSLQRPRRGYQVNHGASGQPDLPVAYTPHVVAGFPFTIIVGREMRQQMVEQQRLVDAQIAMEADYRELRQAEARYRTVFRLSETAHVVLDGERRTVLEANAAAGQLLSVSVAALTGKPVRDLFRKQDRDRLADAIGEARHSGEPVMLAGLEATKGCAIDARLQAYREYGTTNLIMSLSATRDPATAGAQSAGPVEFNLDLLPEAALATDRSGAILAANALFLDLIHAPTHNQVLGRNASTWIGKTALELNVLLARVADERKISGFASALTDSHGEEQSVSVSARFHPASETVQFLLIPVAGSDKPALQPQATQEQAEGFASLVGKVPLKELIRESLDVVEKICIEAALDQTNNNRASAAEMLGLSRQSLYIKLRRYGLENYRPGS
ncbi:transcriptional regulator PpsR [Microvirga tunisiensis]|uniref:Transcriptional regulator PpsR n=2 Tax=Pannonibacter tanglangensis TaxID=2750084 RepID=A0A7X5EZA5_9HYPH|nr:MULTISPECIES: transcriptional regulator PpsR [unclassified Pannonibacter]NBN63105.1 transcriptional regulator PpsR [Pannonibacter sp. XCT-34]NBN76669.1 transcriptional regulator PpsR [Pannonibacter sp. XCT-53]